jgi:hypothetical protein
MTKSRDHAPGVDGDLCRGNMCHPTILESRRDYLLRGNRAVSNRSMQVDSSRDDLILRNITRSLGPDFFDQSTVSFADRAVDRDHLPLK